MKMAFKSIIAGMLCAVGFVATAAGEIPYRDWDEAQKMMIDAVCETYEVVTNEMDTFEAGKTYVVLGDVTNTTGITVNGTVESPTRLILCDGKKLTAKGGVVVTVKDDGATTNALIICGQAGGTGALEAQVDMWAAGIGGGEFSAGGSITINGGRVTAQGGDYAAGIGGGYEGSGGSIAINGGSVTATGGEDGAGIGGGDEGAGGSIAINGGSVTATGGEWGSGIGGGDEGDGGSIAINGGSVTAQGGKWGSGIGGGSNGAGGSVTISGGMVTATGGEDGAGIGSGLNGAGGDVTISGGMVTATGEGYGAGIGGGWQGAGGDVTISGGMVTAQGGEDGEDIGGSDVVGGRGTVTISGGLFWKRPEGWWTFASGCMFVLNTDEGTRDKYPYAVIPVWTVTVGDHGHLNVAWTSGDGSVTNEVHGPVFWIPKGTTNVTIIFTAKFGWALASDRSEDVVSFLVTGDTDVSGSLPNVKQLSKKPIDYVDSDGLTKTLTEYEIVDDDVLVLTNGWWVVGDAVYVTGSGMIVDGDVHLVLCDGAKLTVTDIDLYGSAAIDVSVVEGVTNSLSIYGQKGGTGALTATGGEEGAGIGGLYGAGGTVTINGGMVTAQGGECGAGVGGGLYGAGGTVTINGGSVTAQGGRYAAGIGGGLYGAGGTVTINGGSVTATGGADDSDGPTVAIGGGQLAEDHGTVAFGANVFGGVFTDKGGMTQEEYKEDHSVKFAKMPVAIVSIPQVKGLSYVVSNGTEEVSGVLWSGQYTYAAATGDTLRVYFALYPTCTYAAEPTNPMEVSVDAWVTTVDAGILPTVSVPEVEYLNWNGAKRVKVIEGDYTFVTADTSVLEAGETYVVAGEVVRQGRIVVNGTSEKPTYLILRDGAKLTVTNEEENRAAIRVTDDGTTVNALVICGQAEGTGELEVVNLVKFGAAIGGDDKDHGVADCGIVTINGGSVSVAVQGGKSGAGIGGGCYGAGGIVTVNGGSVMAQGGGDGAGIGGGADGDAGTVTFGTGFAGGVVAGADAASAVYMTTAQYKDDHGAKYAAMPAFLLKIPEAGAHYTYVVSNVTAGAELSAALEDGTNTYVVVKGVTVKVYFTPDEGYVLAAGFTNPMNLGAIGADTVVDAAELPETRELGYIQVAATEALEFRVDSRTGERVIDGSAAETLAYSAAGWDKGAAGPATIAYTLNGGASETFAENLTGDGDTNWLPKVNGTFAFTHTPNDAEGAMEATFVVAGLTHTLTIAQTNALTCVVSNETGVITGENGVYMINAGDKIWVVFTPTEDYHFTGDAPAPTVYDVFDGDVTIAEGDLPETEPYGDLVFKLVRAAQRYPWNGKVDIVFAVTNLRPTVEYALATAFTVKDIDFTKAQTNDLPTVWYANGLHTNTVNVADASWFGADSLTNAPSKLSVQLLRK